jgi:hypothetical protein
MDNREKSKLCFLDFILSLILDFVLLADAVSLVVSSNSDPVRVEGYVPEVVSIYSVLEFKSHFIMQRSTFEVTTERKFVTH